MQTNISKLLFLATALISMLFATTATAKNLTKVALKTNKGVIVIELQDKKAPVSVKNFLHYVNSGFYAKTIFHRVIKGFMIQGGGYDKSLQSKPAKAAIRNESSNGLSNKTGTIAMARTNEPNSATSEFFINVIDNKFLDAKVGKAGYAVFGKVVQGLNIVMKISKQKTAVNDNGMRNVPVDTVTILKAYVLPK